MSRNASIEPNPEAGWLFPLGERRINAERFPCKIQHLPGGCASPSAPPRLRVNFGLC